MTCLQAGQGIPTNAYTPGRATPLFLETKMFLANPFPLAEAPKGRKGLTLVNDSNIPMGFNSGVYSVTQPQVSADGFSELLMSTDSYQCEAETSVH